MSTVSKDIADRVIAGEFSEDGIHTIIKYNNIFNGEEAYKLLYGLMKKEDYLHCETMLNAEVYWTAGGESK